MDIEHEMLSKLDPIYSAYSDLHVVVFYFYNSFFIY